MNTVPALAAPETEENAQYLDIVTFTTRPFAIDKLLYVALKDIGWQMVVTNYTTHAGYAMVDSGEADGVISCSPYIESTYPHLKKVPVPLAQVYVHAFTVEGSGIEINSWDDLSGLRVGVLSYRYYNETLIPSDTEMVMADSSMEALTDLSEGLVDTAVILRRTGEALHVPENVVCTAQLDLQYDYIYLNECYEHLIPTLTASLRQMLADGRAESLLNNQPIADISEKKTVLHIISTNVEISREEVFYTTLKNRFEDDVDLEWYRVSLDSRRNLKDLNRRTYITNLLRQECLSKNIAAIVVSGTPALELLRECYNLYFKNVPVIFYDAGDEYKQMIKGYENHFTGLEINLRAYETVDAAIKLFPETKSIYVVNDYSWEGIIYRNIIREQLAPFADRIAIEYNRDMSCNALLDRISKLPQDSLVFFGSYFVDADGRYYPLNEMAKLLEADCALPVFSLHSTKPEYNALGGYGLDYERYGEEIADKLALLLKGTAVSAIPVSTGPEDMSRWVFDKNKLDRFGIKESWLPTGAKVLNKTPSVWETDPLFMVALIILSLILIVSVAVGGAYLNRRQKEKERKINEARVLAVKNRIEQVIASAPVMFATSIDGTVIDMNEYMQQNTGLKPGDQMTDIYVDPSLRAKLVQRSLREGIVRNEMVDYKFTDGLNHRCLISFTPVDYEGQTAIALWAVDVEKSEKQRDQMYTARQSLQMVLDFLPLPVRITEINSGAITYTNKAGADLFGISAPEAVYGESIFRFLPETQPDGTKSADKVNNIERQNGLHVFELVCLKATGEAFEARVTDSLIDYNGVASSLAIIQDLTSEREFLRMLRDAAEREKEANLLKSRFLVNMSHEIRTPMNAIIGLTEIELHKGPQKDNTHKQALDIYRKINTSAKNLLEIINDILDLSKIEADKIELFDEEFELEEVLNSALLVASPRLEGKNVEFILNGALDLPRMIVGDKTRLWQVLKNFLDNSAKYTESGTIVLTAYPDHARSDDETVWLVFVVEDTGYGISEEQMKRIFQPYEQIYNNAQKKYTGTGLGMAISKQLCELMGGSLEVESHYGLGTTIRLRIPFKRSENRQTNSETISTQELAGVNVLVADDSKLSLDIMERLLTNCSARCTRAVSGPEAMDIILSRRDRGEYFDLILLDYMMEGLNGLETAKQIHLSLSKAPKLLMVTAYQRMLLQSELKKYCIEDVIEKPFISSTFIHKVFTALGIESKSSEWQPDTYTKYKDVRVLLCEDYPLNQEVALGMFEQFGVKAVVAENGEQAAAILAEDDAFDLIFMDLQMPVMDGYEATRVIRANSQLDHIPIISLTADAMKEIVDKCLETGMNDHLAKPIAFSSLHKILYKWLPAHKRAEQEVLHHAVDPLEEALTRFGGNKQLYEKALASFAQMLPEEWPDFNSALEDKEATGQWVHKLKGASGNLGENDIYQSAVMFEAAMRGGLADKALYRALVNACHKAKQRITGENRLGTAAKPKANAGQDTGHTLLIVDDVMLNIDILMEILGDGYHIMTAVSGEDAVDLLKDRTPDLVLLDVYMPGMDGFDVLRFMKEHERLSDIPVIFITGEHDASMEEKGLILGAADYIRKPFNKCVIDTKVRTYLELKSYRDNLDRLVQEQTKALTARSQQLEERIRQFEGS